MANPDVVVIGSGLAGLVVAISLSDRTSRRVTVLEKEAKLGLGNSIKASSGINCIAHAGDGPTFLKDTVDSAGEAAQPILIESLVNGSTEALAWLCKRLDVDLSSTAQLGGHHAARTHRPSGNLPVGVEVMGKLRKAAEEAGQSITVVTNAKARKLQTNASGSVTGVEYENTETKESQILTTSHVVIATGGFAANRDLVSKYHPEMVKFPATQGPFSTGDGLLLGQEVEAICVDLEKIQVHPTGFVDPKDPDNANKLLCAEVLRGVGGILVDKDGRR